MSKTINYETFSGNKVDFDFTIKSDDTIIKQDSGFVLIGKFLNLDDEDDLEAIKHSIESYVLEELDKSGLLAKFEASDSVRLHIDFKPTSIQKIVNNIAINIK